MIKDEIYIRPVNHADAELILDWENNEENWSVSENDSPYSIVDIIVLIGELKNVLKAKQARWMICLTESGKPIGNVDLTEINFNDHCCSIGILIANRANRRKGYALKALQLIESEALRLNLRKMRCTVHSDNRSSVDLFLKKDYVKIGIENPSSSEEDDYIEIIIFEKCLKK